MPFTMSYGEPQTPAKEATPAPKRKRAPATPASIQAQAERKTRRDSLKDKADALFEPGAAADEAEPEAHG